MVTTVNDLKIPKSEYAVRQMASAIMDVLMKQYWEATVPWIVVLLV
jgi:hypothetical protein